MAHQVVWPAVSLADKRDPKNVVDGILVTRGAMLPDWVDDFTLHVLTTTGAVKAVVDPDPTLVAIAEPPAPVLLQEHDPATVTSTGAPQVGGIAGPPTGTTVIGPSETNTDRPKVNDSKEKWLAYARTVERDEARRATLDDPAVTKAELIAKYGGNA